MSNKFYFLSLVVLLGVGGCSSDGDERRQEYLDADYYKRLELPPDLTSPERSKQLISPKPTDEAMEQFKQDSAEVGIFESNIAVVYVGIKVKSARILTEDGVLSLELDESAQTLWPQLVEFWGYEGIEIIRSERLLGFMETDWSSKLNLSEDAGFIETIYNSFDPTSVDKFRLRVEPEGTAKTRIYISHLGREIVGENDDTNQWQARGSDIELEREMLTRLALYVGVAQHEVAEVLATYKPFASRVRMPGDSDHILYITGSVKSAWKRSLRAIDRIGVDVLDKDENNHRIKVVIGKISDEKLGVEKDELSESSWLMQWLTQAPDEDYKSDASRQFNIQLLSENSTTRLEILTLDSEPADNVLAEQLRKSLALELR